MTLDAVLEYPPVSVVAVDIRRGDWAALAGCPSQVAVLAARRPTGALLGTVGVRLARRRTGQPTRCRVCIRSPRVAMPGRSAAGRRSDGTACIEPGYAPPPNHPQPAGAAW
jgi:hypothetical protein